MRIHPESLKMTASHPQPTADDKRRRHHGWFASFALVVTVIALGAAEYLRRNDVRLGLSGWVGFAPLIYAGETGLSAAPLRLDLRAMSQADRRAALAAGRIDCAATTAATWTRWIDEGLDVAVLFRTDVSVGGDAIVTGNGAGAPESVVALRGRRVAAWRDGAPLLLLGAALKAANVPADTVHVVDLDPATAETALARGEVDAAILYGAPLERARAQGRRVLADSSQHPVVFGAVGCRRAVLARRPDLARALAETQWTAASCLAASPTATMLECPTRPARSLAFNLDIDALAGGVHDVQWDTANAALRRAQAETLFVEVRAALAGFDRAPMTERPRALVLDHWVEPPPERR